LGKGVSIYVNGTRLVAGQFWETTVLAQISLPTLSTRSSLVPRRREHLLFRHGQLCQRRVADHLGHDQSRWDAAQLPALRSGGVACRGGGRIFRAPGPGHPDALYNGGVKPCLVGSGSVPSSFTNNWGQFRLSSIAPWYRLVRIFLSRPMEPETENGSAESSGASSEEAGTAVVEREPEPRFVWQTVLLLAYYAWVVYATRRPPAKHPGAFRSSTQVVHLVYQWTLWLVAYCGIRSSGLRYKDVVGKFPTRAAFWSACVDAVYIWGGHYLVARLLAKLGPFTVRHSLPPSTAFQFCLTLLVALSAGYTEEVVHRGLMMSQFRMLTRSLPAAVLLQALVFAAAHGGNQSLTEFLEHFAAALLFAYFAIRRKSLWPSIMGHAWIDVSWNVRRFLRG